jgi:hypothetical protein
MRFDDFTIDPELTERLASWRRMPEVIEAAPKWGAESSPNVEEVRHRQRRIAAMCMNLVKLHDCFVADLQAYVQNGKGDRDSHAQQRVEDEASFALGVFEQTSAKALELGIIHELDNLPREVVQTVYVEPPHPPKSFFQRVLGI